MIILKIFMATLMNIAICALSIIFSHHIQNTSFYDYQEIIDFSLCMFCGISLIHSLAYIIYIVIGDKF